MWALFCNSAPFSRNCDDQMDVPLLRPILSADQAHIGSFYQVSVNYKQTKKQRHKNKPMVTRPGSYPGCSKHSSVLCKCNQTISWFNKPNQTIFPISQPNHRDPKEMPRLFFIFLNRAYLKWRTGYSYPQNVLRNLARQTSITHYTLSLGEHHSIMNYLI